jgi:hypothetical protein
MTFEHSPPIPSLSPEEFEQKRQILARLPPKSFRYESPAQMISGTVNEITQMRDNGYGWAEIAAILHEMFGMSLAPATVSKYWYRECRRVKQKKSSRPLWRKSASRSHAAHGGSNIVSTDAAANSAVGDSKNVRQMSTSSHKSDVESALTSEKMASIFPETMPSASASQLRSSVSEPLPGPEADPIPTAPIATPEVAASTPVGLSEEEWSEEALEAALVIPTPGNCEAEARFRAALEQIKYPDPKRWQTLFSTAMNAGVNVTGTITVPAAKRNAMFNHY